METDRPRSDPRQNLFLDAAARACNYLETVRARRVSPEPDAIACLNELYEPLAATPCDPAAVLASLDEIGSPTTVATAGGRYFGFVTGGALPATLATNILAAAWDQNASFRVMSPIAAALEDVSLTWLRDLLGLPSEVAGAFVTGATMANFTCLAAARHALLTRMGWDVESQGLFGAPAFSVIVGVEAHASLRKALSLLGLGRERVISIPIDDQGRMRAAALPNLNEPALICIQAGNVNTGAFDPATEICQAARKSESWVHVDGAFGLWAKCSPNRAHLVNGFEAADSWATDAHKWLNVPYDCGLAFTRNAEAAFAALSLHAAYLQAGSEREPAHWTPESSRRARGIEVWAALKSLGRSGLAELIERTCRLAERFAHGLRNAGYDVLNEVVVNQVLVSFGNSGVTKAVVEAIQRDGTCWCGSTVWEGRTAMRISVSSWVTDEDDVDRSLAAILRIAAGVTLANHVPHVTQPPA